MESRIVHTERSQFCLRLVDSLKKMGLPASAAALAREFNPRADGAAVSVHGARKWLNGSAFPTQERLHILARWLNVSPQWLRYGEGDRNAGVAANDPVRLPLDRVLLLNDFDLLDARSQEVVRDLVASLLKHYALRS